MDQLNHAYIAGYIDADGCVTVSMNNNRGYAISVKVIVGSHDDWFLRQLKNSYGGNLNLSVQKTKWKTVTRCWRLTIQGKYALTLLKDIEPYMRYKKEQAKDAITILENTNMKPGRHNVPAAIKLSRLRCAMNICNANQSNMTRPRKTKMMTVLEKKMEQLYKMSKYKQLELRVHA